MSGNQKTCAILDSLLAFDSEPISIARKLAFGTGIIKRARWQETTLLVDEKSPTRSLSASPKRRTFTMEE
jgi:hypothetical protein